jgi:site-specific DNA recombinase
MIGTRATGRNRTYRYYTCWNLARYDASKCDMSRLNGDAVDAAVLDALASFYRTRHDLIADAIAHEQKQHRAQLRGLEPLTPSLPVRYRLR